MANTLRKMGVVCCTYNRPQYIGQIIRCFLDQDYPNRELVILDDANQYNSQSGDKWRLISTAKRYTTLGDKRNAAVALLSPDVDMFCSWDDDDLYLPWAVRSCATALNHGDWAVPSAIIKQVGAVLSRIDADVEHWCFGAAWAMSLAAFNAAGGYACSVSGEDDVLKTKLMHNAVQVADPLAYDPRPYFVWRKCANTYHASSFVNNVDWQKNGYVCKHKVPITIASTHMLYSIIKSVNRFIK